MNDIMFSYHGTYEQMDRHRICQVPALVNVATGWVWAAAAHWLTGLAGRLAGVHRPGWALAVWRLDSATARMLVHIAPCALC